MHIILVQNQVTYVGLTTTLFYQHSENNIRQNWFCGTQRSGFRKASTESVWYSLIAPKEQKAKLFSTLLTSVSILTVLFFPFSHFSLQQETPQLSHGFSILKLYVWRSNLLYSFLLTLMTQRALAEWPEQQPLANPPALVTCCSSSPSAQVTHTKSSARSQCPAAGACTLTRSGRVGPCSMRVLPTSLALAHAPRLGKPASSR